MKNWDEDSIRDTCTFYGSSLEFLTIVKIYLFNLLDFDAKK